MLYCLQVFAQFGGQYSVLENAKRESAVLSASFRENAQTVLQNRQHIPKMVPKWCPEESQRGLRHKHRSKTHSEASSRARLWRARSFLREKGRPRAPQEVPKGVKNEEKLLREHLCFTSFLVFVCLK